MLYRKSWDEYFMDLAFEVAKRSTCNRRKIGAVAVRDKRIIATGFNGAPRKAPHCLGSTCYREKHNIPSGERHELCWAVHAEDNVIAQCARFGIVLDGATLYCTHKPCIMCLKSLINAGVKKVIYTYDYPSTDFYDEVLNATPITLEQFER